MTFDDAAMNEEERKALVGDLIVRREEAKRAIAELRVKADRMSSTLNMVAQLFEKKLSEGCESCFESLDAQPSGEGFHVTRKYERARVVKVPDREEILALAARIITVAEEKKRIDESLTSLGIDAF